MVAHPLIAGLEEAVKPRLRRVPSWVRGGHEYFWVVFFSGGRMLCEYSDTGHRVPYSEVKKRIKHAVGFYWVPFGDGPVHGVEVRPGEELLRGVGLLRRGKTYLRKGRWYGEVAYLAGARRPGEDWRVLVVHQDGSVMLSKNPNVAPRSVTGGKL